MALRDPLANRPVVPLLFLVLAVAVTAVGYWPLGLALLFVAVVSFLTD